MDAPLTIACVYKPGGGFSEDYVLRLKAAMQKFCKLPHEFVCLTNQKIAGVRTVPFENNWQGWWNKLSLFRKNLFNGPIAYFDLDTMFVGDITDMLEPKYEFACATNWKGKGTHVNSAMMCWDGTKDFSHVYESFHPKFIPEYEQSWEKWGDQAWTQEHIGMPFESLNERFPDRIVSYKWHVRRPGRVPPGASIVMFHGKPRPHQVNWTLPNGD